MISVHGDEPRPVVTVEETRSSAESLARPVAGTAFLNVVVTALGTLSGIVVARDLGPSGRGDLAAILAWAAVIGLLGSVGLTQAMTYFVAKQADGRPETIGTITAALCILGATVALVGFALAPLIGRSADAITGFKLVFLATPLVFVAGGWVSALQATSVVRWNASRFVQPAVYLMGIVVLLVTGRLTLLTTVAALLASYVVQTAVAAWMVRRCLGPFGRPSGRRLREVSHYGIRSVASDAPWILNARLDQLLLSITSSSAELGQYAIAVSLAMVASPVASAFGSVAFPRIARAESREDVQRVQKSAVLGSVLASAAILLPLAACASYLVPLVFGPRYAASVTALRVLVPGTIAFIANKVMADILLGRGRPLETAKAEGTAVLVTFALLPPLVDRMGINGAAIASVIAYGVSTVMLWRAVRRLPWELHR